MRLILSIFGTSDDIEEFICSNAEPPSLCLLLPRSIRYISPLPFKFGVTISVTLLIFEKPDKTKLTGLSTLEIF